MSPMFSSICIKNHCSFFRMAGAYQFAPVFPLCNSVPYWSFKSCIVFFVFFFILTPTLMSIPTSKRAKYFRFPTLTRGNSFSRLPVFGLKNTIGSPLLPTFCLAVPCPFIPCHMVPMRLLPSCFGYSMYQPLGFWPLVFLVIHSSTVLKTELFDGCLYDDLSSCSCGSGVLHACKD